MKLFSVNAIAEALEKDRATVKRALRNTPPNGKERGQPRWKMSVAVAEIDALPGTNFEKPRRRTGDGWKDERIGRAYDSVLEMYDELQAIDDLEQRRAAAKKWGPVIEANNINLRRWNVENGHSAEVAESRAEQLWHMSINFVRRLCEWSDEEAHDLLVAPNDEVSSKEEIAEYRADREAARAKLLSKLTTPEKTTLENLLRKVGVNPYYFPPEIPLSMWGQNADDPSN
jgi:hypothetical protein